MKKKDLGQHFLVDKNIINNELWYSKLNNTDVVLEIGPGKGALTIPLSIRVKHVIAIEKDDQLYSELLQIIPKNVHLLHADVLSIDFTELPLFNKIIANLPYKISSQVTFKILDYKFEKAILMYQKEFAERMVAEPGTKLYSRLSVGVYYRSHCRILKQVSRNCFLPKPKVDSCVVELIPRKLPAFHLKNENLFFDIVNLLFNHRRKKIKTVIKNSFHIDETTIPFLDQRVEMLTPEEIGIISDRIYDEIITA